MRDQPEKITFASGDNRTILLLILAALLIYLPGIWWGLPQATSAAGVHGWDVDGVTGIRVLSEFHNLFVESKPDWYLAYPLFHYLVLGIVNAPYLSYLYFSGGLTAPSGEYPYGFVDPVNSLMILALAGRLVSTAMACGIIVAAYLSAKTVWDKTTGLLTAAAVMLMEPMPFYARSGNLDVPVLFWTALGVLVIARIVTLGFTVRRAIYLGVCAALAVATKDQAYGAWLCAFIVLPVFHYRRTRRGQEGPTAITPNRWFVAPLSSIVAGAAAYALASGLIFSPQRFVRHVSFILSYQKTFRNVAEFDLLRPQTPAGYFRLALEVVEAFANAMGPVLLAAALVGLLITWRSSWFTKIIVTMGVGHVLIVIAPIRFMQYRYVMFLCFVAAFLMARAVVLGWRGGALTRGIAALVVVVGFGWLTARGTDLTYQMLYDARYEAEAWLQSNYKPGDQLGFFGEVNQLPGLPGDVRTRALPSDAAAAIEILKQRQVRFISVSTDWSSDAGMERSRLLPETVFEMLKNGSLGYHRVAYFRTNSLLGRPLKYYPHVNTPVQIFALDDVVVRHNRANIESSNH